MLATPTDDYIEEVRAIQPAALVAVLKTETIVLDSIIYIKFYTKNTYLIKPADDYNERPRYSVCCVSRHLKKKEHCYTFYSTGYEVSHEKHLFSHTYI